MDGLERAARWIREAERLVFLGGAGVSTLSGIPDFRSADGVGEDFETILSHDYFLRYPEKFYHFYRTRMVYPQAAPNPVHTALARWEEQGRLSAVVTQNIDGLHQAAGSRRVLELHGSVHRNYCTRCGAFHPLTDVMAAEGLPRCGCGGLIKPDVVLYGEPLDEATWAEAVEAIRRSDVLLVAGTSLRVYPAASLIHERGGKLVLINREATPLDRYCDGVIHGELGEAFRQLERE